jgi:hypothetical protein
VAGPPQCRRKPKAELRTHPDDGLRSRRRVSVTLYFGDRAIQTSTINLIGA